MATPFQFFLCMSSISSVCSFSASDAGRVQLRRVQLLSRSGSTAGCWSRALEQLGTRCRDMTSHSQSVMALSFTLCHLSSSGRDLPACPAGSEVSLCTGLMDSEAFNTFTEFFTHTLSMCHFLQAEHWQDRAQDTMHSLTESSAGVVEQLQSSRQLALDLMEAQSAALQAQQQVLSNGQELRETLRDSTQGLQSVLSSLSTVSGQQQVFLSELVNRVSFLQSFLLTETQSLSSCFYNAAALACCFLLTCTQRSSRARLTLLCLVCLNFYLEGKIYQFVIDSDHPEHTQMELVSVYVGVLRRLMVCVAVCVLLCVCVRFRDPVQQSLQVLEQLRETQKSLQEALSMAECQKKSGNGSEMKLRRKSKRLESEEEEENSMLVPAAIDSSDLSHLSFTDWSSECFMSSTLKISSDDITLLPSNSHNASVTHTHTSSVTRTASVMKVSVSQNASESPVRRSRRSSASVYSVLVNNTKPRYSLRSRRSEN